MTPSTRQCAGNGPMPAAPGYGGGTVVPAGTSAALVISTPSILRPARAVQGSADCDWAARGAISTAASRSDSLQCVITSLPSPPNRFERSVDHFDLQGPAQQQIKMAHAALKSVWG